ncbi:hypothetical protein D9M69_654450 [compost metagenome]
MLQLLHALAGELQLHQRLTGAFQVDLPGFGQRHASGGAFEQACAQLLFELRDGLGQGGGRLAELLGGTAEIAVFGRGDKHVQCAQFVHLPVPARKRSCAGVSILPCPWFG